MLSLCVGLIFPGMMLEPGSFSGIEISPIPQRGPLASQRTSLAIFINDPASTENAPWACVAASCPASAANLFCALVNAIPVVAESFFATSSPNPTGALSPVPTAVPPMARSRKPGRLSRIERIAKSSCAT